MARSRIVRPEFWSDEKISSLSLLARLIYIGMWNFSDDFGVVKGSPVWLKSQIFPYDKIQTPLIIRTLNELQTLGRIISFSSNGEQFFYLPYFRRHQVINRPSKTRNPEPPPDILDRLNEHSMSTQRALNDETETEIEIETETEIEIEKKRKREERVSSPTFSSKEPLDSTIQTPEEFVELYHRFCPNLPQVLKITPDRRKKILLRLKENYQKVFWVEVFKRADEILIPGNRRHAEWKPNLDFVIESSSNCVKILEGKYPTTGQKHRQRAIQSLLEEQDEL